MYETHLWTGWVPPFYDGKGRTAFSSGSPGDNRAINRNRPRLGIEIAVGLVLVLRSALSANARTLPGNCTIRVPRVFCLARAYRRETSSSFALKRIHAGRVCYRPSATSESSTRTSRRTITIESLRTSSSGACPVRYRSGPNIAQHILRRAVR